MAGVGAAVQVVLPVVSPPETPVFGHIFFFSFFVRPASQGPLTIRHPSGNYGKNPIHPAAGCSVVLSMGR